MSNSEALFALDLLGPFRLFAPDGSRIVVSSKKGQALIAMLAVTGGGERSRNWVQDKLWGSRQTAQAQASLRNELSGLRSILKGYAPLVGADHTRIWIDLTCVKVDARKVSGSAFGNGEFLEGLDIPGEEDFEDWLRAERSRLHAVAQRVAVPIGPPPTLPVVAPIAPEQFSKLPALAVLPFVNLTGDAAKDIFAEGISEDLLDRLSRLRWLPIIARSSSFAFRGDDIDTKIVGSRLGARYLLEGRLRSDGRQLSLAASLADTENGQNVWSNRLTIEDGSPTGLENILTGLTSTLGTKIDQQEQSRSLRKPQADLNVRELIWRGRWHLNRFTRDDAALARTCFDEALALEPSSPEALVQSAWAMLWDVWAKRGTEAEKRAVRQMAQKAIIADYDDARGHMLAGIAECWLRQPLRSEALLRRAIALNPSLVLAHAQLGSAVFLRDQPEQAIESLNLAIRLSPNDQDLFYTLSELAMSHLMLGNYDRALVNADEAIMRRPAYWHAHVVKINALVRGGDTAEARLGLTELRTSKVKFEMSFIDWLPFIDAKWNLFLKEGLNLAAA